MTQQEAKRINNIAFLITTVGPGFNRSGLAAHAVELGTFDTSFLPAPAVTLAVTTDAKRNQVVHHIVTEPAPGFYMMDFQASHRTPGTTSYLVRARMYGGSNNFSAPV